MANELRLPRIHVRQGVLYADTQDRIPMRNQSDVALASIILGMYPKGSLDPSISCDFTQSYSRKYRHAAALEWLHRYGMDYVCDTESKDTLVDAEARRMVAHYRDKIVPVIHVFDVGGKVYFYQEQAPEPVELHPLASLSAWVTETYPTDGTFELQMAHAFDYDRCRRLAAHEIIRRRDSSIEAAPQPEDGTVMPMDSLHPKAYEKAKEIVSAHPCTVFTWPSS